MSQKPTCIICLAEAEESKGVLCPWCQAVFHKESCLQKWLQKNSVCPACKQEISDINKTIPISRIYSQLNINPESSGGSSSSSIAVPPAAEDKNDTTPLEFLCPLTHLIMTDPVLLPDGVTYERAAIQAHLSKDGKSPRTGQTMAIANAVPNIAVKSLIERYLHPDSAAAAAATAAATAGLPKDLELAVSAVFEGENIHIQIRPSATETRPETIIVAVVDTSGSMDLNAAETIGGAENLEITRLQLVQFSMKTVVNSLEARDAVVLYRFDEDAKCVLALTHLDDAGRATATTAIDRLRPEGGTNIWEATKVGAQTALQLQKEHPAANIKVMIFTDGEPTCRPPQPEIQLIKELLDEMPERRFTISTFSYGYAIDSALMDNIAGLGFGIYGYCPDASLVGTIFINYLAQALNCLVQHVEVEINGRKSVWSLHIANTLNFLVKGDPAALQVTVRIPSKEFVLTKTAIKPAQTPLEKEALTNQIYRKRLIALIRDNLSDPEDGLAATKALQKEIRALPAEAKTPFLEAVVVDLIHADAQHGQVGKAFEPKFYAKWGKDYLRGFARFHELETCGNFKDESLQLYQTPQFGIRRRAINKIFMAMPSLKGRRRAHYPSHYYGGDEGEEEEEAEDDDDDGDADSAVSYSRSCSSSSSSSSVRHRRSTSRASSSGASVGQDRWYDRNGGCWDGDAMLALCGGLQRRTRDVKKGDVLEGGGTVECVVEVVVEAIGKAVQLAGTLWTPWHPVRVNGRWGYACMVGEGARAGAGADGGKECDCFVSSWFDLVVKGNPVVMVNGVETVTLGHGLEGEVVGHPYFGTSAVVNALKKRKGYRQGHVRVRSAEIAKRVVRNEGGMVISMY